MTINRLLTDKDREFYAPTVKFMFQLIPDMMKRKIIRANVQQAFVFDTVRDFYKNNKLILSVGCFDDTAYASLQKNGYNVVGIDPQVNMDLHSFTVVTHLSYDIIFSTSVIEHVRNDEEFLADICLCLNPGGYGILTMDFNNDYKIGDRLPATDLRFYTKKDLEFRLTKVLINNNCDLVDIPDWSGEPEFTHDGCNYSFATFVFRKNIDV